MHEITVENHFYKGGGFFCARPAHGHSVPVCSFFLMGLGEGSQGIHKQFTGAARSTRWSCNRYCMKKRSKKTFVRVGFFVHWRMATVFRFAIFPHGSGGRVPRTHKSLQGLRGPDGEVVIELYEKTVENHYYKGGYFLHWRMATVCRFAIFPYESGKGLQGTHQNLPGAARSRWWSCIFVIVRKKGRKSLV